MRIYLQGLFWIAFVIGARAQVTTNTTTNASPPASIASASSYVLDDKHILEPGDKISFQIIEDRDPSRSLVIADSRELDVPYIGRVSVAGKTSKQLAAELKVLLEKEFYKRATVIVGLDSVNKVRGKVYLLGQVRSQGSVDILFDETLTAGKAILRAGGFADFANKKKVKITRSSAAGGAANQTFEVNMADVLENGKADKDVVLEPGDLIFIPARAVNF
ncbi:MAG: sugar transporter substrate-binding protein [Pedosphaera sp.]|nr:sugar transporter substrate-binding protein [Pedosphaera sp.]